MSLEDRAQEHEAQQWELRNVNRKPLPAPAGPDDADYGPPECAQCGEDMPDVRRAMRSHLCTPCAASREKARR